MSVPASPEPDADQALHELASLTPAQLAGEIRTCAAAVYAKAEAWRSSPQWRGDGNDRRAYDTVTAVIADLGAIPEPVEYHDVSLLIQAVGPILNHWWSDRPGPEHQLVQAVEQLRRTAMHRVGWAADARRTIDGSR